MFDVKDDIKYIGVDDVDLQYFENQYAVLNGVCYNSYVISDEKTAVFDTMDDRKTDEWLKNLETALDGRTPDYLIISHVEPDHSASIPAFIAKYPSATVVGNEKTFTLIKRFYGDIVENKLAVKDGETLRLGKHVLTFLTAPMVHWPEVTVTYDVYARVLFSADAFGKFGALCHEEDWVDEARRYYFNIVGKYGNSVQAILKKISALDISVICPLHGPVLFENLSYYIDLYDKWSSYRPEERGVLIAYASVYGHTEAAALELAKKLTSLSVKNQPVDLMQGDISTAVSLAFKYDRLVLACSTYEAGILPPMETFINKLKAKNYANRAVGFIQNGSWAPVSAKIMRTAMENLKNLTFCDTIVTVNSSIDLTAASQISDLAEELKTK